MAILDGGEHDLELKLPYLTPLLTTPVRVNHSTIVTFTLSTAPMPHALFFERVARIACRFVLRLRLSSLPSERSGRAPPRRRAAAARSYTDCVLQDGPAPPIRD